MNATIWFIYSDHPAYAVQCNNESVEDSIRYWVKKSPGMYDIQKILVVPEDQNKDWMQVLFNLREEEAAYAEQMQERAERAQFERLKAKYEAKAQP